MENIHINFLKFLIVGSLCFMLDLTIYFLLINLEVLTLIAKPISFLCGTFLGFCLNSLFTFKQNSLKRKKLSKYILVYSLSMLVNLFINENVLNHLNNFNSLENSHFIAVISATVASLAINFLGLRYFVFHKK